MTRYHLAPAENHWYWLSFCDPDRPVETQFLGGVIVRAPDFETAVILAHAMECNPGGECSVMEFERDVPEEFVNRLLDRAEIERLEGRMRQ